MRISPLLSFRIMEIRSGARERHKFEVQSRIGYPVFGSMQGCVQKSLRYGGAGSSDMEGQDGREISGRSNYGSSWHTGRS